MIEITAAGLNGWVERQDWLVESIGVAEQEAMSENLLTRVGDFEPMGGALSAPPEEKPTRVCSSRRFQPRRDRPRLRRYLPPRKDISDG